MELIGFLRRWFGLLCGGLWLGPSPLPRHHQLSFILHEFQLSCLASFLFLFKEDEHRHLTYLFFNLLFLTFLFNWFLLEFSFIVHLISFNLITVLIFFSFLLAPLLSSLVGGGCAWGPHQKKSKESVCSAAPTNKWRNEIQSHFVGLNGMDEFVGYGAEPICASQLHFTINSLIVALRVFCFEWMSLL